MLYIFYYNKKGTNPPKKTILNTSFPKFVGVLCFPFSKSILDTYYVPDNMV